MPVNNNLRLIPVAFSITLFMTATLLFSIQPMIGKMLLPKAGGSSAVWNVAMAFFQLCLLGGYFIAHSLASRPVRQHALAYLGGLLAACFFLPIALPAGWHIDPNGYVPLEILKVLAVTIAIPFAALSLSASTLQRLFANTSHPDAADPYFLYAASNLGSLFGLLAYPFIAEPQLDLSQQARLWQWLMFASILLAGLCVWLQHRMPAASDSTGTSVQTATTWKQRTVWLLLAFIPSSLTLGTTTYITSDVAAAPLFWVIPLALYLISFVIAFSPSAQKQRDWCYALMPWFGAASVSALLFPVVIPLAAIIPAVTAFFLVSVVCHSELARRRPPASQLTAFYLCLSIGGALGGSFNALLAPLIFSRVYEYGIVLIAALALHIRNPRKYDQPANLLWPLIASLVIGGFLLLNAHGNNPDQNVLQNQLLILFIGTLFIIAYCYRLAVYLCAGAALLMLFWGNLLTSGIFNKEYEEHVVYSGRSFFGAMTVSEFRNHLSGFEYRILQHGTTTHGIQMLMPGRTRETTAYYATGTAIGQLWTAMHAKSVAVIGLGAGTLNCLRQPGQQVRFIEIDPLVVDIAHKYFSFLSECSEPEITIGDGRLVLNADDRKYDMIIVDAFSSDSVPIHLMTREAIAGYMTHLNPGGVLGFHISNRFFDLQPVMAASAASLGLNALFGQTMERAMGTGGISSATQVIAISQSPATLDGLGFQAFTWKTPANPHNLAPWTDNYSNILAAIKF